MQKSNGQIAELNKEYKEIADLIKQKHAELAKTIDKHGETLYQ